MRIGYYLSGASSGIESGGTAPYSWRMLNLLLASSLDIEVTILTTSLQKSEIERLRARFPQHNIRFVRLVASNKVLRINRLVEEWGVAHTSSKLLKMSARLNHLDWQLRGQNIQLIHCPFQHLPLSSWHLPTIVTMHDVQEMHFPEFFTPKDRLARARNNWLSLELARKIIVSYQHIKDDLIKYFKLSPKKINVCPLPIDETWLPQSTKSDSVRILAQYQIQAPFLLYPAQTWQHKNHIGLLRALAFMRDANKIHLPMLVCTGHKNAFYSTIESEIERLNLSAHVRFLGVVSEIDLAALYKQCLCVVVPTLYEAGSFPVIEAMMSEVPVICSRVTSLPDTIGDLKFTFDANDIEDMARVMTRVIHDSDYREQSILNGQHRLASLRLLQDQCVTVVKKTYLESLSS